MSKEYPYTQADQTPEIDAQAADEGEAWELERIHRAGAPALTGDRDADLQALLDFSRAELAYGLAQEERNAAASYAAKVAEAGQAWGKLIAAAALLLPEPLGSYLQRPDYLDEDAWPSGSATLYLVVPGCAPIFLQIEEKAGGYKLVPSHNYGYLFRVPYATRWASDREDPDHLIPGYDGQNQIGFDRIELALGCAQDQAHTLAEIQRSYAEQQERAQAAGAERLAKIANPSPEEKLLGALGELVVLAREYFAEE